MYKDQGNIVRAMECFKKSVEVNPFWHAAFWYFKDKCWDKLLECVGVCVWGWGGGGGSFLKFSLFRGVGGVKYFFLETEVGVFYF